MSHWDDRGATPEDDIAMGCFESGVITTVDPSQSGGWTIGWGDSWCCGLRDCGVTPKVGDRFTSFGRFGRPFHGQSLNGKVLWYDSIDQQKANWEADIAEADARRKREFANNLSQMDAAFEALPPEFKVRILRNRAEDPNYRWAPMGEAYEVFTCQQAVILAEWALEGDVALHEACAKIDEWNKRDSLDPSYDYQTHIAMVPGWSDAHSGNTHGFAVVLAKAWIMGKKL